MTAYQPSAAAPDEPSGVMTPRRLSTRARSSRGGGRSVAWWGLAFVVLLLLSAGMADVPNAASPPESVRTFYTSHTAIIVVAQVLGLLAAVAFGRFSSELARTSRAPILVRRTGLLVALGAGLTAAPVLVLAARAGEARAATLHRWTLAGDATDVLLFAAIALFGVAVARGLGSRILAGLAIALAVVATARAVLLAAGSSALGVVAPSAFVGVIAVLTVRAFLQSRSEAAP